MAFRADGVAEQILVGPGTFGVAYEAQIYDLQDGVVADNYDPVTATFTAPVAGVYRFAATANGTRTVDQPLVLLSLVSNNGDLPIQRWFRAFDAPTVDDNYGATAAGDFLLAVGQTVSVQAIVQDTGTFVLPAAATINRTFCGSLVAPNP